MLLQVPATAAQISAPIAAIIVGCISAFISVLVGIWVAAINRKTQKIVQQKAGEQARSLENHKSTLSGNLEKFKSELLINVSRQGILYKQRLDVIDEMYKKLVELSGHMHYMVSMKPVYEGENGAVKQKESEEKAQLSVTDFNNYLLFKIHYFKKEHAEMLEKLRLDVRQANMEFFEPRALVQMTGGNVSNEGYKISQKKAQAASDRIRTELPKAIKQIEEEFRKLLGVED